MTEKVTKELTDSEHLQKLHSASLMAALVPRLDRDRDSINEMLEKIKWNKSNIKARIKKLTTIIKEMQAETGFSSDAATKFIDGVHDFGDIDDIISKLILQLNLESAKINLENTKFDD
jgi:hypothetical protein